MSLVAQEVLVCHFCIEPITKMNGTDSDSLLMHHITYTPEISVPAHRGCNVRYHNTHPNHPQNPKAEYRKRFIKSLGDNVFCHFCDEKVTSFGAGSGRGSNTLAIHSLDGDHDNWDHDNKVPAHKGCHTRYHSINIDECVRHNISVDAQNTRDEAWRKRRALQSAKSKRYWADPSSIYNSAEFRARQSAVRIGVPHNAWPTRRERYGPSGVKDPEQHSIIMSAAAIRSASAKWGTRRKLYGPSGVKDPTAHSIVMKVAGVEARKTRLERYGPTGHAEPYNFKPKSARWRARQGERVRRGYAWKNLAQIICMLFDGIVDERTEAFLCPYCNRAFLRVGWLKNHISTQHKSRELGEFELLTIRMVKRVENGENRNE